MNATPDAYHTLENPSEGFFRDRGSKFYAYAYPVFSEQEWQNRLEEVRKLHPKARHYCFAFRLGLDGNNFRANDDGEPSGTAGRPILGQIDSFEVTNVFIVVVRYFGGTLLGASGLIQAYRESAAEALRNATIVERIVENVYRFTFDYAIMGEVMNALKSLNIQMIEQDFGDLARVSVAIRQGDAPATLDRLRARVAGVHLEELATLESIEGFDLEYLGTR